MFELSGDIRFVYLAGSADTLGPGDVVVNGRDLESDETFETAVLLSTGTDARARDTDTLPATFPNRGGYWGRVVMGFDIGNRLWLLGRSKLTDETVSTAKQYVEEGYAWMIEDGIVDSVDVTAIMSSTRQIDFTTTFRRPQGDVTYSYFVNWEKQLIGAL